MGMEVVEPKKPEKVKIFSCSLPEDLEKAYGGWIQTRNTQIEIIKRQFRVGPSNIPYIALFYREK